MADHVRKQIRDAVTTAVTGLAATATRVHKSKVFPVKTLPALAVYVGRESSEESGPMTMGSARFLERNVNIMIDAHCNNEDEAETVCKQVEVAMSSDTTFGGLAKDSYIITTELFYGNGDEKGVVAVMNYRCMYHTTLTAPDVAL